MSQKRIILKTFIIIFILVLGDFIASKIHNKIFREFYPIGDGREQNKFYHHDLKKSINTKEISRRFLIACKNNTKFVISYHKLPSSL